jgi:hypothetical protein
MNGLNRRRIDDLIERAANRLQVDWPPVLTEYIQTRRREMLAYPQLQDGPELSYRAALITTDLFKEQIDAEQAVPDEVLAIFPDVLLEGINAQPGSIGANVRRAVLCEAAALLIDGQTDFASPLTSSTFRDLGTRARQVVYEKLDLPADQPDPGRQQSTFPPQGLF